MSQLQLPESLQEAPESARRVYVALRDLGPEGSISGEALESQTGMSRRSVWRALRRLEALGLLERLPQTNHGGMKQPNRYRVRSYPAFSDVPSVDPHFSDVPSENRSEEDVPDAPSHPELVLPETLLGALSGAPESSRRVCAALCTLEPGDAVSGEALEGLAGMSRRSVWRALRDLADRNLIERQPQTSDEGMKQANRYRVRGLGPDTPVAPAPAPVSVPLVDEHLVRSFTERLTASMRVHPSSRWWEQAARGDARTVDAFHQDLLKAQAPEEPTPDRRSVRAALLEAGRRHRRAEEIQEAARELALEAPAGGPPLAWICDVMEQTGTTKAELLALYVAELLWLQTASNPRELPAEKLEASAITYRRGVFVFVQG